VSVATGIAPTALLELDWRWLEAVEQAAVERLRVRAWGPLEAMLADLLELTHASYVAYLATHLKKGARLPSPIKVPRPNADGEWPQPQDAKPAPLSPAAFAAAFAPSSSASSRGSPRG